MRVRNKLSVKRVASLTKPNVYSDGGGLYLRVRPSGTKSWVFVKIDEGKRREFGLGSAIDVPLAEARDQAARLREAFRKGLDPSSAVQCGSNHGKPSTPKFGAFFEEFLDEVQQGFKNEKHRKQWRSTVHTYASSILDTPINEVCTDDIVALLKDVWLNKPETARRVRGRIERTLDAAKVRGLREGENPARFDGHLALLLPKQNRSKVTHHPALPFAEMPQFMAELRLRKGNAARALEFTILTAARSGETRGMCWSEVDVGSELWTIPASRMKANEEHQVPLSAGALELVKSMQRDASEPADRVFHNGKGTGFSDMALTAVLRRMGHGNVTVHGFRSTFRDWAGETTSFSREDIEMALAHQVGSKTERAYRRGRSVSKRRDLMKAWTRFCLGRAV